VEDKIPMSLQDWWWPEEQIMPDDKNPCWYENPIVLQINVKWMRQWLHPRKRCIYIYNSIYPIGDLVTWKSSHWKISRGGWADIKNQLKWSRLSFEGNYYTGAFASWAVCEIVEYHLNDMSWWQSGKRVSKIVGEGWNENYHIYRILLLQALEIRPDNTEIMAILFQGQSSLKNAAVKQKKVIIKRLIELKGPKLEMEDGE